MKRMIDAAYQMATKVVRSKPLTASRMVTGDVCPWFYHEIA